MLCCAVVVGGMGNSNQPHPAYAAAAAGGLPFDQQPGGGAGNLGGLGQQVRRGLSHVCAVPLGCCCCCTPAETCNQQLRAASCNVTLCDSYKSVLLVVSSMGDGFGVL